MKISFLFVFPIVFFCSLSVFAQGYITLFNDYIPESVRKDADFQSQVNINIGHYASVDPDLVYYYIKYIETRFGDKVTNPDSNYYNLLREKDYEYRKARNVWVQSEIRAADEISPVTFSSSVKRNLLELYQEDLREYKYSGGIKVDKSFQAYFTFMLLRGKKSQYNEKFNYQSAIQKELEKKIKEFEDTYSKSSQLDASARYEMIDESLKYPYLFKDGYLDKYRQPTDLKLYEFISQMLNEDYLRKNAIRAGIFYFKSDFKNSRELSFAETPFPYYHFESNDEVKIGTGVFIDLGFQLGLRKFRTPFSYVEIDAGYGVFSGFTADDNLNSYTIQRDSYQPSTGTHGIVTYTLTNNNETSHYELYGRIAAPVYYFNRNIFVEAGLNFFYTSVKRNCFDLSRQIDTMISNNPDDFQEYNFNYSYEFRKGNLYPSVAFNYTAYDLLNFKAEYMIPFRLIAKVEVLFNF